MKPARRLPITKLLFFAFLFFVIIYALLRAKNLILGPIIKLDSPNNGALISENPLLVSGTAQNISKFYFGNRIIFTDEKGNFREKLLLASGYNILELKALDRFGREVNKTITVVYK